MSMTRFGTLFKEVRRAYDLSQVYLATKLGMSQPHLSKIESGQAEPNTMQWLQFCREFKLDSNLPIASEADLLKAVKSLRLKGL